MEDEIAGCERHTEAVEDRTCGLVLGSGGGFALDLEPRRGALGFRPAQSTFM